MLRVSRVFSVFYFGVELHTNSSKVSGELTESKESVEHCRRCDVLYSEEM